MKMKNKRQSLPMLVFFVLCLAMSSMTLASEPTPPPQPESGPGGSDYPHAEVAKSGPFWAEGQFPDLNFRYVLYEPSSPTPPMAPVVLFLHGWRGYRPDWYQEWINHMVKKGYTVVWAQYDDGFSLPLGFLDNIIETMKAALKRLESGGHVPPETDGNGEPKTAVVGHSLGAYLGVLLAGKSADTSNEIPKPYAVVAIEPGSRLLLPTRKKILNDIDPATKMVLVVGDEDRLVCTKAATFIWEETFQIPDENRDYLLVLSDETGSPPLVGNHLFPLTKKISPIIPAPGDPDDSPAVDALDFFVTFKLGVAALNCAFRGTDCEYALGDGAPEQVDMGQWSDGQPVTPMTWVQDPSLLVAQCDTYRELPQPSEYPVTFREVAVQGFGDRHNSKAWSMIWWNGHLYVGTAHAHQCLTFAALAAKDMERFDYQHIVDYYPDMECTECPQDLPLQAEIWRYEPVTQVWKRVFQSPDDVEIPEHPGKFTARDAGFRNIIAFTDPDGTRALYAGAVTSEALNPGMPPPRILRSTDGQNWQPVPQDPGTFLGDLGRGQANWRAMAVYKDRLFAVNADLRGGGVLVEAKDPAEGNDNFRVVSPEGMTVYEMAVFNGYLYIGTGTKSAGDGRREGFAVKKTDATGEPPYTFTTVVEKGGYRERLPSNAAVSMFVFKDALYVGTDKPAEMIRIRPDDTWDLIMGKEREETPDGSKTPLSGMRAGFDDPFNQHIWRMAEHNGILYVGTNDARGFLKGYRVGQLFLDNMGYDLAATPDGVNYTILTRTGFDKPLDIGIRVFASTPLGLFYGTSNPFYGLRIYQSDETIPVRIDIEPESNSNEIDLDNGDIAVAILTTRTAHGDSFDFDATSIVDRMSVRFGPSGAIARDVQEKEALVDVDDDGDLDLLLHFEAQETGIQSSDASASLTGKTVNEQQIMGSDFITVKSIEEPTPTTPPPYSLLSGGAGGCFISVLW